MPRDSSDSVHLRGSDLRGLAQLGIQATRGVTRVVEGVHQSVWRALGFPDGADAQRSRGLTGLIYQAIHGATQVVGSGLEAIARKLPSDQQAPESAQRLALLSALNGVLGDHLVASGNPFAIPMSLRSAGLPVDPSTMSDASGRILLLVHGLCMNDTQWCSDVAATDDSPALRFDHGQALAESLGYTPLYLRYNSGLHVAQNGRQLASLLEDLVERWPVPVEQISIVGHSMGGLLARSAVHYASEAQLRWPQSLAHLIFLGTPHHGSPLERAGFAVDTLLARTPYSAPFARLGQLRSAGITDLRHGHVLDLPHGRFERGDDCRQPLPLPTTAQCYTIAATTAKHRSRLVDSLSGDGLVPLHSALGHHHDPQRCLNFAEQAQWIVYQTGHLQLLSSGEVQNKLREWLGNNETKERFRF